MVRATVELNSRSFYLPQDGRRANIYSSNKHTGVQSDTINTLVINHSTLRNYIIRFSREAIYYIPRNMSLLPFLIGYEQPRRLMEQDFGLALTPDDLLTAAVSPLLSRDYYRPWRQLAAARDMGSSIKSDKDKFQVNLDVQHFKPEEITVKTVDGYIVVEGKHDEKKDDHGFISRQFTRRYALPEGCNPDTVESRLSSDGVLSVIAPKVPAISQNRRSVPIAQTGPVRKEIKDQTGQAVE